MRWRLASMEPGVEEDPTNEFGLSDVRTIYEGSRLRSLCLTFVDCSNITPRRGLKGSPQATWTLPTIFRYNAGTTEREKEGSCRP